MTDAPLDPLRGVMGYLDRPSAAPGERLGLHVSCDSAPTWRADLVRLLSSDLEAHGGPSLREEHVRDVAAEERPARDQATRPGSYVLVQPHPALPGSRAFTVSTIVCPTLPGDSPQALVSRSEAPGRGWTLQLDRDGAASLRVGGEVVSTGAPLHAGCWYAVAATVDPATGRVQVAQVAVGTTAANRFDRTGDDLLPCSAAAVVGASTPPGDDVPLLLAAARVDPLAVVDPLEGRLEHPTIVDGALGLDQALRLPVARDGVTVIAAWDFAAGIGPGGIAAGLAHDAGPHALHGRCLQHPTRGVGGHAWDGTQVDFRHAPGQYAAAHFHSDDLTDCGWEPQLELEVPAALRSGVYAIRLRAGDAEDRVPFVVTPPPGGRTAPILLVLPTNSYLAYANQAYDLESPRVQLLTRRVPEVDDGRRYRAEHRGLGASLYDTHPDGTGICVSSWRRPILTMRPAASLANAPGWQFTADLQIVDWLDRTGRAFDVVTDRDVHDGGVELLARYPVVVTGTHPEYPTAAILDATRRYVVEGGRLVYMGGNGFYWVTAYDPDDPHVIEIRRIGGTEAWRALPGEAHLSFTGEPGGLWRARGLAPQKLTGVGFVAQGLDASAGYRKAADLDPRAAWVFDGVTDEMFGLFGTMGGGAAGLELDAVDALLGTPPATIVLASSEGHSDEMLEARENYGMTLVAPGGARNPRVRADMTLLPLGRGGVFSTGSIAFAGSLAHDDYCNAVSRILGNVIDRWSAGGTVLDS